MDFLDPRKKRAHSIRLFIGYFLMAVAISIGTLILLLEAFGYDLYNRNGEVIQNGLVFVGSRHVPSDIVVNGRPEGRTNKRLVLPEASYNFQLLRDGYRMWERKLNLQGHMVVRLTYPQLIPEELETESIQTLENKPLLATQSLDRKWLVMFSSGSLLNYQTRNLDNPDEAAKRYTLPVELFNLAGNDHELKEVEWSDDNRHVLLKHNFQGGSEYIMFDHLNPELSFNLRNVFNIAPAKVSLLDKNFDRFHLLDGNGNLWLGEAPSGRLTPLARKVIDYKAHGSDVILFATEDTEKKNTVSIQLIIENDEYELRELPLPGSYLLDLATFDGNWYIVAGSRELKTAYVYRQPFDILRAEGGGHPAPITVLRLDNKVDNLSFSANARFIGAHSGAEFTVYDAEHDRQYRYDVDVELPDGYKAKWMDAHRYSVYDKGNVTIFDFDGSNRYSLSSSMPGTEHFFDKEYKNFFTFDKGGTENPGPTLNRTHLLTSPDR